RPLPREVLKLLRGIPKGAIPMEVARTAVSYMATFPRKKGETFDQFNRRESLQLTSTLPTIVASYERIRKGKTPVRPDPRLGHVDRERAACRRVMGFGHRIYRTYDPRARILKNIAEKLAEERGGSRKWLDIAEEVERIVMDKRKLWPNIEFYAAVVLNALGVPKDLMPAVFACNRVSGWIAHIYE